MTLHLDERLDLAKGKVLAVAESDQLVEGTEKFVGISGDLSLVETLACTGHDLRKEVKRIDVL